MDTNWGEIFFVVLCSQQEGEEREGFLICVFIRIVLVVVLDRRGKSFFQRFNLMGSLPASSNITGTIKIAKRFVGLRWDFQIL